MLACILCISSFPIVLILPCLARTCGVYVRVIHVLYAHKVR